MDEIKLRDLRVKEKYQIDDAYLNGYARLCGWKATIVYNSLCRHASKDQYSFPSVEHMAEQHGVSRDTILRGIKDLEKWNVIQVTKTRTEKGTFKNNGYVLIDKSQWKSKNNHVAVSNMDNHVDVSDSSTSTSASNQVAHSDSKDTHTKDTHTKDNNTTNVVLLEETPTIGSYGNPDINEIQQYFLQVFQIPKEDCTQRQSRQYWSLLVKESKTGVPGVKWLIDLASQDEFFRQNITSGKDLYYKRIKIISRKRGEFYGKSVIGHV